LPQEKILDIMLHFKPFPPLLDDCVIRIRFLATFMVLVYQFLVHISHPCDDSLIDIHLSQEERVGRIVNDSLLEIWL